jgi:membrane-associated protease RseP (regulator of RpoE activity)
MRNPLKTYLIQGLLFVLTVFTTTLAGADWVSLADEQDTFWTMLSTGLAYSIPFLGILTLHEFGHYFTARYYKVEVTLPYYLPIYFPGILPIGTLGAFIRMNSQSASKKEIFDIGVAGPLAGFFAALLVLYYGFTHLPDPSYIYQIHPEYKTFGTSYPDSVYTAKFYRQHLYQEIDQKIKDEEKRAEAKEMVANEKPMVLAVGKNLIFLFFEKYVVEDKSKIPHAYELYHYPILFAGLLALFFTALNLIPIGQLDGGHVIYGLFGYKKHKIISSSLFVLFIFVAGIGVFRDNILNINFFSASITDMLSFVALYLWFLYFILQRTFVGFRNTLMIAVIIFFLQFFIEYLFPWLEGLNGWLAFALLLGRFLGTHHPPAIIEEPLDWKRKLVGWFALLVFVLCFTPQIISFQVLD